MKNTFLKSIIALVMAFMVLPMMSQDFMTIYLKDGSFRQFYMSDISEITTSNYDEQGILHGNYLYQHITSIYDKYIYNLEDIDSISFIKINEELAEENFVSAMPKVINTISDCETVKDAETKIFQIKNIDGVEDAWCDGHQLYVKIVNGDIVPFHFSHNFGDVDNINMDLTIKKVKELIPQIKRIIQPNGRKIKAVIANQQHKDETLRKANNITEYFYPLMNFFNSCDIDAKYLEEVNVDFFLDNSNDPNNPSTIYDYDLILLSTHGGYSSPYIYRRFWFNGEGDWCHHVSTSEELAIFPRNTHDDIMYWSDYYKAFKKWRKQKKFKDATNQQLNYSFSDEIRNNEKVWVVHPYVTDFFFRDIVKRNFTNPQSILFNAACQSLKGDNGNPSYTMAQEFFKKNLGLYIGYDETNWSGQKNGYEFFLSMLNGNSNDVAYELLDKVEDDPDDYGARMHKIVNPGNDFKDGLFLFPVVTHKINTENANQEFNQTGLVTVEGTTIILSPDPISVKCGFKLFIEDVNVGQGSPGNILEINDIQGEYLSSGTSNFRGKLIGLEKDKTYYYQAYTYDGIHCNSGDTCKLIIYSTLTLPVSTITLEEGTSYSIDITSGSGSYSILNNTAPDVVTASIGENNVSLEAHKPGSATITIKDDKSGQEAVIEVTVTYVDIPAAPINLGLPSGTLWASYNVGAFAEEDYGHYFAWGERKEKDVYNESTYEFCKNGSYTDLGDDIGGTEFDVAHVRWGGNWMMPNKDMIKELYENCTTMWTTQNGVDGTLFTGPNGATLFLPAAGYRKDDQQVYSGVWGDYWSSSASESYTYSAYELYFKNGLINCDYVYNGNITHRINGHTVRPVIPGLQLSSNGPLSIVAGKSETVTVKYGSGSYGYEIDKDDIVSVSINGATITISALQVGNAIVTVTDSNGGKANISVAVKAVPKAIDLGLPSGTKWASFNIGASKPEEYGDYYAWGETETKDVFNESTYEHCKNGMYTKIGDDIRGTEFDVAHEEWGDGWTMPSTAQFNELMSNCTSEWGKLNGVYVRKFTSKINGESIYLPASGYHGNDLNQIGSYGYYWSGNLYPDNTNQASSLCIKNGSPSMPNNNRYFGFTIRPVISGLELSTTGSLTIFEGNSKTITIKSGSGSYDYSVDNDGIVSVSVSGSTITINALKIGDVNFTVTDTEGGQQANIIVNVRAVPKVIDLGLPSGTKWANVNVGANSPEEYGDYYAWGETEVKSKYNASTYHYYKNSSYVDVDYDIRGSEYDVAHVKWGGSWMMPSSTQMNELIDNCTSEWTTVNGVYGQKFTSKINGNSIFLPAVGYCESGVSSIGNYGYYWSCSSKAPDSSGAYSLGIKNNSTTMDHYYRYYGFAVRPVIREKSEDDDPRLDEVVSDALRNKLEDHMPIYNGTNPPNVEGAYLLSPYTTVFCEDGHYEPGHVISPYKIKFFNQSFSDNTIDMIDYNANNINSYSKGSGAFISGDGSHFSIYFITEGYSEDIFNKTALVVSGTKTDEGIKDFYYGFVMTDKGSDPNHKLMDVGVYRVFKDGDGISEPTTWEFENSSNQMRSKANPECETMVDGRKSIKSEAEDSKRIE